MRRPTAVLCVALACLVLWPAVVFAQNPIFLGVYAQGHFADPGVVLDVQLLDSWLAPTGRRTALGADFFSVTGDLGALPDHLDATWNNGWIPFIKLFVFRTAADIVAGQADGAIAAWGQAFALWTQGGTKRAFIAPLPEMNGDWVEYYCGVSPNHCSDHALVRAAYHRVRDIVREQLAGHGVPQNAISWVFAPNGWGLPGDEFEKYYPGHNFVDVVAFSAYNWGACPPWHNWDTFEIGFEPYLHRMRAMAPGKPIFIAEMAVIDDVDHPIGDRDEWFRHTYTSLAAFPALRGIVYLNRTLATQPNLPNCPDPDFRVHVPGTDKWQGFKDAMANPASNFGYWAPTSPEVANIVFAPTVPHVFDDVHPIHPFAREPGDLDFSFWIHKLAASGITSGCTASPPQFCPNGVVTRAQMAVFLLRAMHGAGYVPPAGTGHVFGDVPPGHFYAGWIEQLAAEGITSGCGGGNYCPDSPVTRAQMAVFLLRASQGAGYGPPTPPSGLFLDVPASDFFAAWIEDLAAKGVTGGCGGGNYCPTASVTRQQMAVFLVRAFGL